MTKVSIIKSNKSIVITKDDITFTQFGIADEILDLINEQKEEIERLKANYERIYNENCKLRENHNINDITLLDENERLNKIIEIKNNRIQQLMKRTRSARINKAIEYIHNNYPVCAGKELLEILQDDNKQRKGEVISLEELESYEPKNIEEQEYYDNFWN